MTKYFKATQPNGTDFYSGTINYAAALKSKRPLKHPYPGQVGSSDAADYISVATIETDCTSFRWPARLFEVEPVGDSWVPSASMPNKRAVHELRVVRELPAWRLFGTRGHQILAIFETAALGSSERARRASERGADWTAAYDNLWSVVRDGRADRAGLDAARVALRGRLGGFGGDDSAYGAALAVLLKDLIDASDYDVLVAPYADVIKAYQ